MPYIGAAALTALLANAAHSSYQSAKAADPMERKLKAFRSRPRYRTIPARAYLSTAKPVEEEETQSATRLPQTQLRDDDRVDDPTKSAAAVLLAL